MSDLRIKTCPVGQIGTNCYMVYEEKVKKAVLIDPGASGPFLLNKCRELGVTPEAILLTHGHFDHIGALKDLKRAFPEIRVYAGEKEKEVLSVPELNLSVNFGESFTEAADYLVKEGETITISGLSFQVLNTPGHTCGSVCYWMKAEEVLFSGDTLFCESLGRTDFPTGNSQEIIASIKEKLFVLPDETIVYPGHGEQTTIRYEKKNNPVARLGDRNRL